MRDIEGFIEGRELMQCDTASVVPGTRSSNLTNFNLIAEHNSTDTSSSCLNSDLEFDKFCLLL